MAARGNTPRSVSRCRDRSCAAGPFDGQIWNSAEFARSFGVADTAIRRNLNLLTGALVVRQLHLWHAKIAKRQVKAPKIYPRDAGVLHALLGINHMHALNTHPKSGASWEGFLLLETIIDRLGLQDEHGHFWATHTGAELDLLITRGRRRIGIEIKRTTMPKVNRSMRSALADFDLSEAIVVHAGPDSYRLVAKVGSVAASRLDADLRLLSSRSETSQSPHGGRRRVL